jgi:NTE family protein
VTERFVNLVFQGGGVKGIAYAGILSGLPKNVTVHSVGGTSVGALFAALVAIGKKPHDLLEILRDPELRELLDKNEYGRFTRLSAARADFAAALTAKRPAMALAGALWQHRGLAPDLLAVWNQRGLFSSTRLRAWLDRVLEHKTFEDINVEDLRIVAADVNEERYTIFRKANHLGTKLAHAVHASASIPIFFAPMHDAGGGVVVDGGLLSNYPHFLFSDSGYPTVGFRLGSLPGRQEVSGTEAYLLGLINTATSAHDEFRERPQNFSEHTIEIPTDPATGKPYAATKFYDLEEKDILALYAAGQKAAERIDWIAASAETPQPAMDPKPIETLSFSMAQVADLLERYHSNQHLWAEQVQQQTFMTCRIEPDWTVRYEKVLKYEVSGQGSIVVQDFISQLRRDATFGISLVDVRYVCEEIDANGNFLRRPVMVPAVNQGERRGFAIIHTPPISAASGPRWLRKAFAVEREFALSVARNEEDFLGCVCSPLAHDHKQQVTFEVLVADELPRLKLQPEFTKFTLEKSVKTIDGRTYDSYVWTLPRDPVGNQPARHRIRVTRERAG